MRKPHLLSVSLFQMNIAWEDKQANLERVKNVAASLKGNTDILILPEMFTTGFSMNCESLAETNEGLTIKTLTQLAIENNLAIIGSFIAKDKKNYYNRGFFVAPNKEIVFYDKRHLFSLGKEPRFFSANSEKQKTIVNYKGWNICLMICYDLRFPVYSRNCNREYDLLVYVASWPKSRRTVWSVLLKARAIENYCFVAGVNRCGVDANQLAYSGDSQLVDFEGSEYLPAAEGDEFVETVVLDKSIIDNFLKKFPVDKDGDSFFLK